MESWLVPLDRSKYEFWTAALNNKTIPWGEQRINKMHMQPGDCVYFYATKKDDRDAPADSDGRLVARARVIDAAQEIDSDERYLADPEEFQRDAKIFVTDICLFPPTLRETLDMALLEAHGVTVIRGQRRLEGSALQAVEAAYNEVFCTPCTTQLGRH